jgi:iron complex transport system permease protein
MKTPLMLLGLAGLMVFTALFSLSLGRYPVSWVDITYFLKYLLGMSHELDSQRVSILNNILIQIRLPRIAAAVLIGASLSVSGVSFQSMFMNPLVSPGLLGVLAGASLGAAVGIIVAESWLWVQISSIGFGLLAVLAAVGMAAIYKGDRLLMLILGGIISGALFTALLSVVKYLADPYDQLPAIVYWLMGGLSMADGNTVLALCGPMITGILMLFFLSNYMNVMSMGEEEARSLGVNVRFIRLLMIFFATLISALTVAIGGIIGWVGLVIPHLARMIVGPDNRVLLPAAALIGAIYLLIADDMARLLFRVEIPIGILTSLVGIPFFALVLRKAKKGWH